MSHFSVLVVTKEEPTDESLAAALQPFHEFECTGVDDQYVVDVDVTDEVEEQWSQVVDVVRLPDGKIVSKYDNRFYTKDGEQKDWQGQPRKEFDLPAGCELAEIPRSELAEADGETKEQFAKDYGGWEFRDGRFWDRTNPNKKWDWWTVGGRYSGKFKPWYDPETDPKHQEVCWLCRGTGKRTDVEAANGCNGCNGTGVKTKWPTEWKDTPGNQIRVGDIPWNALRDAQVAKALEAYDTAASITKGMELPQNWDVMRKELGIDAAREKYHANEAVKALHAAHYFDASDTIEDLRLSREDIAARAARRPITCWALLKDGIWSESGSMGWFGMSSDDKDPNQWTDEVNKLLESLPPDSWLTCVDCHI